MSGAALRVVVVCRGARLFGVLHGNPARSVHTHGRASGYTTTVPPLDVARGRWTEALFGGVGSTTYGVQVPCRTHRAGHTINPALLAAQLREHTKRRGAARIDVASVEASRDTRTV